jgi:hypothetical protein
MMRLGNGHRPGSQAKPRKGCGKRPSTANERLAEQIRKIIGKHYASKYRVR